ncbi:MAG: ABC transporter ATP-binding protein [Vicinamibacteria bacterium]|jgi:ABC-2 type transport system ATP-binding protein|nr:ABC transporter ATP-binding protein [Vicinamibacteria bacterium]
MTGPIAQCVDVSRRYGALTALDRVSFDVRAGEMFGLIGPDGAGKTTALRILLGLLRADAGSVMTWGVDPLKDHRAITEQVGYLSQRFSLYGDLTVDENIAFFAELHAVRKWNTRREELLQLVRMTPFRARLADRLSGGMRQKLALACTLIHTPRLLVLDEPTTGVDPVSRRDFWRLLARLLRDGLTLVVTTPYLDEAERCSRVALLDHGRLLALDTPDRMRAQAAGGLYEVIARPFRQAAQIIERCQAASEVEIFGERLHVTLPHGVETQGAWRRIRACLDEQGIALEGVRPILPGLEDVFIHTIRSRESQVDGKETRL